MAKYIFFTCVAIVAVGLGAVYGQAQQSPLYVPLIGITSVPDPLSLPGGAGSVTYHYAVKNFLREAPLTNIRVVDDVCSSVVFVEGDDNYDAQLDFNETWRYVCQRELSATTQSVATATGMANNLTATHKAYSTVVVGSDAPAPLVSIINITKVAYPLSLPAQGGSITFTYRVNNPGIVPLSNVAVVDDKCSALSGRLGDTNGNNLLDVSEVWVYTCTAYLNQTTTNTVSVSAFANGLRAVGYATITVTVADSLAGFLDTRAYRSPKMITWGVLLGVFVVLLMFSVATKRDRLKHPK